MADFLWQGECIDESAVEQRLPGLAALVPEVVSRPLPAQRVVDACDRLSQALSEPSSPTRQELLAHTDGETLDELAGLLRRAALERKLIAELGDLLPDRLARIDFHRTTFEGWVPVGLLAHVTASNSPLVAVYSAVEGLLTGNLNVLKVSASDTLLAHHVAQALSDHDGSGEIAQRLIVLRFSSARTEWMRQICGAADAVAAWGGESAIAGVADLVPPGCRLVEWGHKISFAYLTWDTWNDPAVLADLAASVCRLEQRSCSSPQVVYLDTNHRAELETFARRLADRLATRSRLAPPEDPPLAELAEITTTVQVARLEEHLGLTSVLEADDRAWRVLVDVRSELRASPLYRTVWVKPLPRTKIAQTLRPMRRYLQTAGVAAAPADLPELSRMLFAAGVLRVTTVGRMQDGYDGEPHDGVYALARYSRRVSVTTGDGLAGYAVLDDLLPDQVAARSVDAPTAPVSSRSGRSKPDTVDGVGQLYVCTGGTTGKPTLSAYDYASYRLHMRLAGEGLVAAGFDVQTDRAANLFMAGNLTASFLFTSRLLEEIGAVQFPLTSSMSNDDLAESIVDNKLTALLGFPSALWQLFREQAGPLRAYRGVRKIFYAGEHFSAGQRRWLLDVFGVELVKSFSYASTEVGTVAHQCSHSDGGVLHVFPDLNTLEIVDDAGRPVASDVGRLVVTARQRRSVDVVRYDSGDVARWVPGDCDCGRRTPRIELMGRGGDVVRVATHFLNYATFAKIAEQRVGYVGPLQLVLEVDAHGERLLVRLDADRANDAEAIRVALLGDYPDLVDAVRTLGLLRLAVQQVAQEKFDRSPRTGKIRRVVDLRGEDTAPA